MAEDGYNWYVYGNQNPVLYADYTGEVAVADDAVIWIVAAGVAAVGATIIYYKEHKSNKRKSTKNKHQEGQARKQRDAGGEKGDARRMPRKDKRK